MSAAAPNPNNMLLLAVIGIGAYWLMTRRAMAQPVAVRPGSSANNTAGMINAGVNALGQLFGGGRSSGGQRNPIVWDGLTNDMPSPRDDGVAVNNPFTSAFDWWTSNGTGGD